MPVHRYKGLPSTGWHVGELSAQRALGWEAASAGGFNMVEDHLDAQHRAFHPTLQFLPLATLDADGRPWATFLTGKSGERGFISSKDRHSLQVRATITPGDPTRDNLKTASLPLVAGVGVELLNRRRNKFGGYMKHFRELDDSEMLLDMQVNSALGNCPKYINVRDLAARPDREMQVVEAEDQHDPTQPLSPAILQHIAKIDSVYVATAYLPTARPDESHLGMNHRGGRPGFLRVDPDTKSAIYLPDFSGNRLMQSVGNMVATPVAGLALPDWETGDVLYVTGRATVYLGDAARTIMRSVHGIAKIEVTGYRFIRQALPFVQKGDTVWSQYDPPVRFLNAEEASGFNPTLSNIAKAQLQAFRLLTPELAIVTFQVTGLGSLSYKPGQYVVLDCSSFLHPSATMYRHMAAPGQEGMLNDDGIRSWTISGLAQGENGTAEMAITMRVKPDGAITPMLFAFGQAINERNGGRFEGQLAITFPIFGIAGQFVPPEEPTKQLWLAAGVGITPFLSFLRNSRSDDDIHLVVVTRLAEVETFEQLIAEASPADAPHFKVSIFVSKASSRDVESLAASNLPNCTRHPGRLLPASFADQGTFPDLAQRMTYLCGTAAFRSSISEGLVSQGIDAASIHSESFAF